MTDQRWAHVLTAIGVVLLTVGIGFTADAEPPFVRIGTVLDAIGLACFLFAAGVGFQPRSRW